MTEKAMANGEEQGEEENGHINTDDDDRDVTACVKADRHDGRIRM